MFLKRHFPIIIVIVVGLLTLFGHFINQKDIQNFVDNDATQWFDIIASFAIFLGALNMIKLQSIKIMKKQKNWQYSILAVAGFAFAIVAGFFYRGANYITLPAISEQNISEVANIIAEQTITDPAIIEVKIISANEGYEIDTVFINRSSAGGFMDSMKNFVNHYVIKEQADSSCYIIINDIPEANIPKVASMIWKETHKSKPIIIEEKIIKELEGYTIDQVFITIDAAEKFMEPLKSIVGVYSIKQHPWGTHVSKDGSLFSWMYKKMYTPLSATMFALLAFFVASASYRAFRIRNFEATLLLISGIILMLGRVPIGELIPWWAVSVMIMFGVGAITAPWIKDRKILFGLVACGIFLFLITRYTLEWGEQNTPAFLNIPAIQRWIFDYPATAGSRALMIGIGLGILGTSFRIIMGIERSFLGE